jgi:transcriptional regulator with XRE-family HTH domain
MIGDITNKLKTRRQELGLKEADIARLTGLSWNEYFDIELHPDEIFTVTKLYQVKKICEVLNLDFFELFEMKCIFCEDGKKYDNIYSIPVNELIKKRREEMGISREELGDRIGFYEVEIENLENNPDHLKTWTLDYIKDLSKEIDVPLQVLLKVRCSKCGR